MSKKRRANDVVLKYFAHAAYLAGRESRQAEVDALHAALFRVTGDPSGYTLGVHYDIDHPNLKVAGL